MNKRIIFIFALIIIVSSLNISAQEYSNKFDFKIGTGLAFLGHGDVTIYSFENELNYKINNYFSTAISIGLGRGGSGTMDAEVFEWGSQDNYFLGSISVFVSPFKNNKRHNLKLGGGYSFFHQAHAYVNRLSHTNQTKDYYYDNTYANLFNITLEYEYRINSRFMIGGKLFTTCDYSGISGDITSGLVKFGIAL